MVAVEGTLVVTAFAVEKSFYVNILANFPLIDAHLEAAALEPTNPSLMKLKHTPRFVAMHSLAVAKDRRHS